MHKSIYILFLGIVISMSSCRKDFDTVPSKGNLGFSKQTVYLDTVFSNISSSTYMLKVYNRSSEDISIPSIRLARPGSKYRLMVDGMTGIDEDNNGQGDGRNFPNVELLAKDSLFIFIETTAGISDANPDDFLYTDEILFQSINGTQQVKLVTLIQDAVFLYPEKDGNGDKELLLLGVDENGADVYVEGFELNESDPIHGNEFHFTNEKPYVIYGFAGVPAFKTLVIDAGARVHFHADSGIIVKQDGNININGMPAIDPGNAPLAQEVIFEGDRLEPQFSETPGQWFSLWLLPGSGTGGSGNTIEHLTLKNATVGILADQAPLIINNSQIYNSSNIGLLGRNAVISGKNLVINTAGKASLACTAGGNYQFTHCTFNNNWPDPGQVSVLANNYQENADGSKTFFTLSMASFKNCIIYGSNNVELFLDPLNDDPNTGFSTNFEHCLVKFNDAGTGIANDSWYDSVRLSQNGNIKSQNPQFHNPNANNLRIFSDSPAVGLGDPSYNILQDILGVTRTLPPDSGAYQNSDFAD